MRPASFSSRLLSCAFRVWTALVLAAVTSSSTLAWAAPCCLHDDEPSSGPVEDVDDCCPHDTSDESDEDRDEPCSCPLDCGPCCAGMPSPALAGSLTGAPSFLPDFVVLSYLPPVRTASDRPPHDVLHVPKPAALSIH